jgi:hypothetical protein
MRFSSSTLQGGQITLSSQTFSNQTFSNQPFSNQPFSNQTCCKKTRSSQTFNIHQSKSSLHGTFSEVHRLNS